MPCILCIELMRENELLKKHLEDYRAMLLESMEQTKQLQKLVEERSEQNEDLTRIAKEAIAMAQDSMAARKR